MTNEIQPIGFCHSWNPCCGQSDSPTSLAQFGAVSFFFFLLKKCIKEKRKNPPSEVTVLPSPGSVSVSTFHTDSQSSYSAASVVPALSAGAAALRWQRRRSVEFFKCQLFHGLEKYFLLGILAHLVVAKKRQKCLRGKIYRNFMFVIRGNIKFISLVEW